MNKIDVRRGAVLGFTSLMLTASAGWAHDDREGVRFQATLQATSKVKPAPQVPQGRCADPATLVGLLEADGAGDTNLLGVVFLRQSHCVRTDLTFNEGVFTLTNPQGKKVEGRYFGRLEQTVNSIPPPPLPAGVWNIKGYVCIESVGGRAVSHCGQPSKNYDPARGITDLTTGAATIFLDQFIRFKH